MRPSSSVKKFTHVSPWVRTAFYGRRRLAAALVIFLLVAQKEDGGFVLIRVREQLGE